MVWAVLILLGVVVVVHWLEYRRSVQEYSFAQPGTLPEVRDVIGEKTPIVVEIGTLPWRPEVAQHSAWIAAVGDDSELEMPITNWLEEKPRLPIQNGLGLATEIGIETGLTEIDDARPWWWMAGLNDTTVGVLERGNVKNLEWVAAERKWVGCTSGAPLLLWLAHSRYQRYLPSSNHRDCDPWHITSVETPWIGRVQYIEVRVKPGWAIAIPAHWGFAVKCDDDAAADSSWWWTTTQHSPLSMALTRLRQ
jgi:hypothetical protein